MRRPPRWAAGWAATVGGLLLSGCSVLSPMPLWELAKAGGAVANSALDFVPAKATDTVWRGPADLQLICIEGGPTLALPDLLPALQASLALEGLESRVLPERSIGVRCSAWLQARAEIEWAKAPWSDTFQPYLDRLDLRLVTPDGRQIASSRYSVDASLGFGRWTATREKVAPVVAAVLHGPGASSRTSTAEAGRRCAPPARPPCA